MLNFIFILVFNQYSFCRFELIPIRFLMIAAIIIIVSISSLQSLPTRRIIRRNKRGFAQLNCFGVNDRAKFASLNHVCEECYQLYRDQNLHKGCRYVFHPHSLAIDSCSFYSAKNYLEHILSI